LSSLEAILEGRQDPLELGVGDEGDFPLEFLPLDIDEHVSGHAEKFRTDEVTRALHDEFGNVEELKDLIGRGNFKVILPLEVEESEEGQLLVGP